MILIITAAAVLVTFAVLLLSLAANRNPELLPPALRLAWTRLQQLAARLELALNEAIEAARAEEAERLARPDSAPPVQFMPPQLNPDGSLMPLVIAAQWAQETTPAPQAAPVEPEREPTFFLLEIGIYCHFAPLLSGVTVQVTPREYRRLVDYCALAFDQPLTPEATFAHAGLELFVKKGR